MSLHNVGDMVATYTDTKMKHHAVGWINELVDEIIWHGDIDSRNLRYKIEWADGKEDIVPLYTHEEIEQMKIVYEKISKTNT